MLYLPKGDAFAQRNRYALAIDFEEEPPFFRISDTHYAATWLLHPFAPKLEMPPVLAERIKRMEEKGKMEEKEEKGENDEPQRKQTHS
jgi:oligopeptide transport system ATP-binding protein